MSSTNRGAIRKESDFYETPDWLAKASVEAVFSSFHLRYLRARLNVLDPCSGRGVFGKCVMNEVLTPHMVRLTEWDIQNDGIDFLTRTPEPGYDLIITNPPYSLALEFRTTRI